MSFSDPADSMTTVEETQDTRSRDQFASAARHCACYHHGCCMHLKDIPKPRPKVSHPSSQTDLYFLIPTSSDPPNTRPSMLSPLPIPTGIYFQMRAVFDFPIPPKLSKACDTADSMVLAFFQHDDCWCPKSRTLQKGHRDLIDN